MIATMRNRYLLAVIELVGICDIGVGSSRIIEYILGQEKFFIWKGEIGMAFSTATVTLFEGIAFLCIWHYLKRNEKHI